MNTKHTIAIYLIVSGSLLGCSKGPSLSGLSPNQNEQKSASSKTKPGINAGSQQLEQEIMQTADGVNTKMPQAQLAPELDKDGKNFLAISDKQPMHELSVGEAQIALVCSRNANKTNKVVKAFCIDKIRPKNLIEFQTAIGLNVTNPAATQLANNGDGANPSFTFTAHSSSLVGRFTSAINPRAIIFSDENRIVANPDFIAMGFVRGEQLVEIAVNNPSTRTPDFFLASFQQACNSAPGGCTVGELLTPAIEKNWTSFTLYQDEDLKNSIVDCRQCHQPQGVQGPKILRMSELRNPWTHFFRSNTTGGAELISDYYAAHGTDETYAGIPGPMIRSSDPLLLEGLVVLNGFSDNQSQHEFNTSAIESEVRQSSGAQPADNSTPGTSRTWDALFARVVQGTTIPVPYHDVKVTEPALLDTFTRQYQDFRSGVLPAKDMKDHREIFRTDQKQRADMGFAVAPGTSPQATLMLACKQCHNSALDQSVSRSKFNVDLAAMPDALTEIDVAIARLRLGYSAERLQAENINFYNASGAKVSMAQGEHVKTMPPRRFKALTDQQIDDLISYLAGEKAKLKP